METQFITIQVSAKTYWGFQYKVPLVYALSVTRASLAKETQTHMKNFFETHNLQELKDGIDKLHLHIHQEILPTDTVVYACNHIHNNENMDQ
jgi:hypothetical protein